LNLYDLKIRSPVIFDQESKTVCVDEYSQFVEYNGKMAHGWTLEYKPTLDLNKLSLCRLLECIINARLKDNEEAVARLVPLWDKKLTACKSGVKYG